MSCPRTQQANLLACSPQHPLNVEHQAWKLWIPFFEVLWYDSTMGMKPSPTNCKVYALTTMTHCKRLWLISRHHGRCGHCRNVLVLYISLQFVLFNLVYCQFLISCNFILGSGYFAVNNILPLEAILLRDICDWSILIIQGVPKVLGTFQVLIFADL